MFLISFPRLSRAVAWATMACFVVTQNVALAGPHEEGVTAGEAANPEIGTSISTSNASTIVPGYTATPSERSLYGEAKLTERAEAKLSACAATPDDPSCQAMLGARDSANTARPGVSAYDSDMLAARRISENPQSIEDIASFYGGCTVTASATPTTEMRACRQAAANPAGDECAPFIAAGCTLAGSECRQMSETTGACDITEKRYACTVPASATATVSNCPANVFCFAGECFNTAYTNDADFARSMSYLEAAREAGVYLDPNTLRVFSGEAGKCRRRLLKDCCYSDSAGASMSNQSVSGTGSRLVFDILMNSENRAFLYNAMTSLVTGAGFSGTFSAYGVSIAVNGAAVPAGSTVLYSGQSMIVAVDPWTLAIAVVIYVVMEMSSCDDDEGKLAMQEGAKLCHTVGSYCSSRILGSCTERKTGKCCFNSMLARLINEQGRMQVSKGWGSAKYPDCSGFTVAELQRLDFSRMNLTEFYSSIVPTLPNAAAVINANRDHAPSNCYYGEGKCQ
ncbi:MAG: conjugal transfer protein TraN [Azoarcus sp.]|nr:conjugal transfer protein TraN [Azoarcus sp.]